MGMSDKLKILIDADACPVKEIAVKVASEYGIPVVMVADTSHEINSAYAEVIIVDKSADSADLALFNISCRGDIVITQDYGVAAMALGKKAYALNQNGLIYDDGNIGGLLEQRHMSGKLRRAGKRPPCVPKRTGKDSVEFEKALRGLVERAVEGRKKEEK